MGAGRISMEFRPMSREEKVEGRRNMILCFVCEKPFRFGQHVYDGRVVQGWNREVICPQL